MHTGKVHVQHENRQEFRVFSLFVGELFVFCVFFWSKKVMNFENFEHRSVIKLLTKEGIEPKDIYERLVNVYRDDAP